jgi:Ferritin-like domain
MRGRRRDLLVAAAATMLVRPAAAAAQLEGDPAILARLIAREDAAAFAYRDQANPGVFAIAAHEAAHAKALRTQLAALGHEGPPAPAQPTELDEPARRVAGARGESVLSAAIALEESLLAAYRDAVLNLAEPSILRTAATIMASHAQHHALLGLGAISRPSASSR